MKNDFIMTTYFYPLPKGGTDKFFNGVYFDNPRTKSEILEVAEFLKKVNYSSKDVFPESHTQVPEGYLTLEDLIVSFYENNKKDKLVRQFYSSVKNIKDVYYIFAKMWVIIRCDKLLDEEAPKRFITILFSENAKISREKYSEYNYEIIKKYLLFIGFMTPREDANRSIIIDTDPFINNFEMLQLHLFTNMACVCNFNIEDSNEEFPPHTPFNISYECYKKYLKFTSNKYEDEKFLYLCDLIEKLSSIDVTNEKMYLLGIIGIIEMLLTHNPDSSMYNIEDSISKQYIRKMKYIIYKSNKDVDLDRLEKELKLSYKIRSDFAHGNFNKSSKKNLEDLLKFYNMKKGGTGLDYRDESWAIEELNGNLQDYTRAIIDLYLTDEKELELIKDL